MDWKPEEDIICCEVCVYEYVIQKNNTDINTCIKKIKQHASIYTRDEGSIREKIQNIKAWLEELHIENTIPISIRPKASKQMKEALISSLKNIGYLKTGEDK